MNTEAPFDQDLDKEVTSTELDEVLDANKDLYDKLNQIPEIRQLKQSLSKKILLLKVRRSLTHYLILFLECEVFIMIMSW